MIGAVEQVDCCQARSSRAKPRCAPILDHPSSCINPDGFTLIELLVVISILAMLMAILLPTLQRVRNQAKAVACQARLRQWGVVFAMYMNEHSEQRAWDTWRAEAPSWRWSRRYYRDSNDVLLCPAATRYEVNKNDPKWEANAASGGGAGSKFTAWKVKDPVAGDTLYGSYGFNPVGHSVIYRPNGTVPLRGETASSHLFRVGGSRTPILLDAALWWASGGGSAPPPAYDGDLSDSSGMKFACVDRHDGAVNSLFVDWSVRRVGLKELWTLRWYLTCDIAGPWTKAGGVQPEDWPRWMRRFKDY